MLGDADRRRVEEIVRSCIGTHSRDFARLRESGKVPLDLLSRGALEHPRSRIRRCCLILLDHLGDVRHVPVLAAALKHDPVPRNRRHALHALTCQKCKPFEMCADVTALVEDAAKHDANDKVRQLASELLD